MTSPSSTIWRRRHDFAPALMEPTEAVRRALATPVAPVVLIDVADNVGGGAPGDGTVLLQALLDADAEGAVVVLWAPEAAAACRDVGVEGRFRGPVGGSDGRHGPEILLQGVIELARPVTYERRSSYMTGQQVRLGDVAVVAAGGVRVVLTERRAMPFDADHLEVLGIDPAAQRILVCKSAIGWRAAFGDVAADAIFVDTPGVCASNLDLLPFARRPRPLFPLDPEARYPT